MITDTSIQQVKDAARIDEVIGDYLSLQKAGANLKACCPFHNEKTPSFSVNLARNIYKCFGCGAGGDSLTFVMQHTGKSFPEAVRILAAKYSVAIEEAQQQHDDQYELRTQARTTAAIMQAHFAACKDDEETPATRYWRDRGFSAETLDTFGIGYCDGSKPEHMDDALMQIGCINEEGNVRFYKRTTIPICDRIGNVTGWGGRALAEVKGQAKYINSPDTIIYQKSKVLFNLHRAAPFIRTSGELWIVEGYADAMAMHQMGQRNCVALCGTALTPDQVNEIRRFNLQLRIILAFDNEIEQGKSTYKVNVAKAFRAALDNLIDVGEIRTVIYPKAVKDMADLMRTGGTPDKLEQKDAIQFMVEATCTDDWKETASPVEVAEFQEKIARLLAKVKRDNVRNIYVTSLCGELKINPKELATMVKGFITEGETEEQNRQADEHRWIKVSDEYYERLIEHDIFTKTNSVVYRRRKRQELATEGVAISRIPRFHDWICVPSHTNYQRVLHIDHDNETYRFFNSYQPMPHQPVAFELPEGFIKNPDTFDYENIPEIRHTAAFMKHIFGWEEHRDKYLTLGWDWITLCYLNPTQRMQALCLVSSEEGTGKSTFINLILAIFGQNATKTEASRIGSNFNSMSGGKIIQCVEETKDEKGGIENKLKDLITSFEKVVEAKHQDARVVKSFDKYIFASNHEDGFMKVGTETTRFAVMKVNQIKNKVPDFEEKMYLEIPYLLYFMQKRGVVTPKTDRLWFDPKLWENEALLKLRHASKDQVQQVMEDLLQSIWLRANIAEPVLYLSSQYLKLLMCAYGGKSYEQKTPVYFQNTAVKEMRMNYWDNPVGRNIYELKNIHTDAFINASEWEYEVKRAKSRFIEFPIYKFVRPEIAFDSYTILQCEELIQGVRLFNNNEASDWANRLEHFIKLERIQSGGVG